MSALKDTRLAFIGTGIMAEAMIKGILTQQLVTPDHITGSEPHAPRRQELSERYHIKCINDNAAAAREASIVVLSVKPQVLPGVLPKLRGEIRPDALVLSIVAGARIGSISAALGHNRIIRVMPNTPAQIGPVSYTHLTLPTIYSV